MNTHLKMVLLALLAVGAAAQSEPGRGLDQAQDADLGPGPGPAGFARADEQGNKKDKRGLLAPVYGYEALGPAAAAPYGVPVAYAAGGVDAYGAYGAYSAAPYAYGAYRTPAVAAPYGLAAGYAAPVAKVGYSPALAGPAASAYAAYTDGVFSRLGAYAFPAPYGYVAADGGLGGHGGYAAPVVHGGYAY